jgi:transposase
LPSPLSLDLRTRAIEAYERGEGTQVEIAARFGVGEASIRRWWRLKRENGSLEPNTDFRHGPAPLLDEHGLMVLRELLEERPDSTLEELGLEFRLERPDLDTRSSERPCWWGSSLAKS